MSQPAKAPEPTIDEILASIRRSIVPDDDAAASKPAAGRKSGSRKLAPAAPADASVPGGAIGRSADGDAARGDPAEAHADVPAGDAIDVAAADAPVRNGALLSPRATAAVDTAFHSLSHTVLSQNPRTLEDLVRDMLKPMLKEWLDANLPDMVERLVRAEIERVSRRG
jgi:uncharacterized protein